MKGVTAAVTVQPDPDPVASTAVSVKRSSWLMSYPLRVFGHLIVVEGAATASDPAATVADPVMVQVTLSDGLSSPVHCFAEAADDNTTMGPTASTPATSARTAHFADPCCLRSFNMDPPPLPSTRKDFPESATTEM